MAWHIEYTNHPLLTKKRRKTLERLIAEAIGNIERLLELKRDEGFFLGSDFNIESKWVEDIGKHHVAVCSLKDGGEWVATVVFENRPTMTLDDVKAALKAKGFSEYSLYALGVTNQKTVRELLSEMEAGLTKGTEEYVKEIRRINISVLETFLEKGIIKLSDGLLDAFKKIEEAYLRE